ncbi:MAG: hypothetical protein GXO65_01615 [Euryarchaeota archaeon]|nr:hypothetical protein [Euryarchaeota archaeon]
MYSLRDRPDFCFAALLNPLMRFTSSLVFWMYIRSLMMSRISDEMPLEATSGSISSILP